MKLNVDVNNVTLVNTGVSGEFKIKNSAKAFKILSDGLYSNKIRAIIRELSCNAVDSHFAAGKSDIPFELHLPTIYEPWFSVRDFGTGLDGNQVVNIYTTYFESTKTDSNDFIGALGLGSKSPFSYTENFTVTAIKNGMRRIYSAFINEMGIPCVVEMDSSETDEDNGVEVKFSVTDRYDYDSFRHEADMVLKWFKLKPVITGYKFSITNLNFKEENIIPGVHLSDDYGSSVAVMGNICYPLNKISEPQKYFGKLADLLNCALIMHFPIGSLDFSASREELSYIPLTINSIKNKLQELNDHLAVHIADKANAIPGEWDRAIWLANESRIQLFREAVAKYVTDTNFKLFQPNNYGGYGGLKNFEFIEEDLFTKYGMSVSAFRVNGAKLGTLKSHKRYDPSLARYVSEVHIHVQKETIIVLDDLKKGAITRARYHFSNKKMPNNLYSASVYCLSIDDPILENRQAIYDKFLNEIHNPPLVFKASELEKAVPKTRTIGNQGLMVLTKIRKYMTTEYVWQPYTGTPDPKTTYYYCALNGWQPRTKDDKASFDIFRLKTNLDLSGIKGIDNISIIGVRKSRIAEISKLKNWIWIEDKVKKEISKITINEIEKIIATQMFNDYKTRVYIDSKSALSLKVDSPYRLYVEKYSNINSKGDNVLSSMAELCSAYGTPFTVDPIKTKILSERDAILNMYPMLKYFPYMNLAISTEDLISYINMVDANVKETRLD